MPLWFYSLTYRLRRWWWLRRVPVVCTTCATTFRAASGFRFRGNGYCSVGCVPAFLRIGLGVRRIT